jgi:hypothetical protein
MPKLTIRLYTRRPKWLFFKTGGFAAEVSVRDGRLIVDSADMKLKTELEKQLEVVHRNGVLGIAARQSKGPTGRKIAHVIQPKQPDDPTFLAWIWENDFWSNRVVAGHEIVKGKSGIAINPS